VFAEKPPEKSSYSLLNWSRSDLAAFSESAAQNARLQAFCPIWPPWSRPPGHTSG